MLFTTLAVLLLGLVRRYLATFQSSAYPDVPETQERPTARSGLAARIASAFAGMGGTTERDEATGRPARPRHGVGLPTKRPRARTSGQEGWCVMNGRHRSATAAHSTRTNCRPGIAAKRTAISRLGVPDATATPHGVNHLAGAPARVMTPARVTRLLPQRGASRGTGSPATARGMCPANPGMAGIRLGNPGLPARVGSISHRMRRGPICRRTGLWAAARTAARRGPSRSAGDPRAADTHHPVSRVRYRRTEPDYRDDARS